MSSSMIALVMSFRLLKDNNCEFFKVKNKRKKYCNNPYGEYNFKNVLFHELSYKRDGKEKSGKDL